MTASVLPSQHETAEQYRSSSAGPLAAGWLAAGGSHMPTRPTNQAAALRRRAALIVLATEDSTP